MKNEGQRINPDWFDHRNLGRALEVTSLCLVIITKKHYETSTNRLKGQAILRVALIILKRGNINSLVILPELQNPSSLHSNNYGHRVEMTKIK